METRQTQRRAFLKLLLASSVLPVRAFARQGKSGSAFEAAADGFHVYPGGSIQDALDAAARTREKKTVFVHAGTYRPAAHGQALIWFNARHDGLTVEAVGDVILTAANPAIADPESHCHPAVVNHVVYFGDEVSRKTVFRGFKITGANNFTTGSGEKSPIESDDVRKTLFFYADGGGIKIYARSVPTIENVEVYDNYTSPCGGGVSVEHLGSPRESVLFRNCIFRNNRTQITGAGFDLLHNSKATLENCLFVGNISNTGVDYVGILAGGEFHPDNGSGAMTVFAGAQATVSRCTFTGNWNGVDDAGSGSTYTDSIFWRNTAKGGISPGRRYEIDIEDGAGVKRCFVHGEIDDLRGTVARDANTLAAPDPQFDAQFVPRAPQYAAAGYRPITRQHHSG
jgi:Right handed beta helix region